MGPLLPFFLLPFLFARPAVPGPSDPIRHRTADRGFRVLPVVRASRFALLHSRPRPGTVAYADTREERVKRSDLAILIAAKLSIPALFESIGEALAKGESVSIAGFATFSVKDRAARQGRNPRTGESIVIAASRVPLFKAGKGLRDAMN